MKSLALRFQSLGNVIQFGLGRLGLGDTIFLLKTIVVKVLVVCIAACLWLPCMHLFFSVDTTDYRQEHGIAPKARMLAERHLAIWRDPALRTQELESMQKVNPEWDFMSRTYFVLALANMAMRDSAYSDLACEIIDAIIDNTLRIEKEKGKTYFLLGYAQDRPWVMSPARSQFIDGEIAIMMAARRFIREDLRYKEPLQKLARIMIERMERSPVLSAESYPNQCWLFCNTVSLAAIRMMDVLDGSDHSTFLSRWVATAKARLVDRPTGMLISSYAVDGTPDPSGECPEGSTIFMSAHMLEIVDPDFAHDQYRRAAKDLSRSFLGFGYAIEWPSLCQGRRDVDSGPIVPFLDASAGSSGMAVLGAAVFNDDTYLNQLLRSLEFAAFPDEKNDQLVYHASNPVGDAVLLYGLVEGPLWHRVMEGRK
jgi:hypothetical protein